MAPESHPAREPAGRIERIARNLVHLGTGLDEWRVAPRLTAAASRRAGAEGTAGGGRAYCAPAAYTRAPTLYPDGAAGGWGNCELCGHRIRIRHWIYHDRRRWMMAVGSECIRKFKVGQTGR